MDTENKIRILLVEDNPDDCKWYQNCYSVIPGVELSVVNTMTEGVRAVRERRPDALILDHQLTEGKSRPLRGALPAAQVRSQGPAAEEDARAGDCGAQAGGLGL